MSQNFNESSVINTLRQLFQEGNSNQVLSALTTLDKSICDVIEHIDYADHDLPSLPTA